MSFCFILILIFEITSATCSCTQTDCTACLYRHCVIRWMHLDFVGVELPLLLAIKSWHVHSSGDETVTTAQGNGLERPLDAVKNGGQQSRT